MSNWVCETDGCAMAGFVCDGSHVTLNPGESVRCGQCRNPCTATDDPPSPPMDTPNTGGDERSNTMASEPSYTTTTPEEPVEVPVPVEPVPVTPDEPDEGDDDNGEADDGSGNDLSTR